MCVHVYVCLRTYIIRHPFFFSVWLQCVVIEAHDAILKACKMCLRDVKVVGVLPGREHSGVFVFW